MSLWDRDFESGLPDDVDATITHASFGTDSRYGGGEMLLLKLTLEGTDGEGNAFERDELISCGKGWETNDGGKTIVHSSGKDRYFNKSSVIARIIDRCINEFGIGDLLRSRGEPFQAHIWEGLRFHWKQEELNYGPGIDSKPRLMPVKYLGEGAAPAAQTQVATTASGGGAAVAATASASADVQAKVLRARLVALAKACDTHTEFVDRAMEEPGVTDDAALLEAIVDESALYAEARG